jgi:hypothetical protein
MPRYVEFLRVISFAVISRNRKISVLVTGLFAAHLYQSLPLN